MQKTGEAAPEDEAGPFGGRACTRTTATATWDVAPNLMVPVLLERWPKRPDQIRLVGAHFPLCTRELLEADSTTFTVLRDPVDGTTSTCNRELNRTDWDLTLEEMYDDRRTSCTSGTSSATTWSRCSRSGRGRDDRCNLSHGRLEEAKEALEEMEEFGFQEDLEGFAERLEQRWGWRLGGPRRDQPTAQVKVSRSLRRRIAEDTLSTGARAGTTMTPSIGGLSKKEHGRYAGRGRPRDPSPCEDRRRAGTAFVLGGYCYHPAAPNPCAGDRHRREQAARRAHGPAPR